MGSAAEAGPSPAERLSADLGSEMPPEFQEPGQKLYPHRAVMFPKEGVKRKWGNRADATATGWVVHPRGKTPAAGAGQQLPVE